MSLLKSNILRGLICIVFLGVAVVCVIAYIEPSVVEVGFRRLQKRLWMGAPAKTKLHVKDTIFKHAAVATDCPICSDIGRDIMKNEGGSAVDAAIASLLCLGVMNPHSTGIGGGGFMMVYIKDKAEASVIDFRESAPRNSDKDLFEGNPENGIKGGKAVAVPGELRGMETAHKKYGKVEWKKLFQPAIRLCKEGFKITDSLGIALNKWKDEVAKEPCLKRIYMRNGKHLKEGDIITNLALGETLTAIAEAGNADPIYNGDFSGTIIKDIKKHGGIMTKKDLIDYEAIPREPLLSRLGEFTVLTAPPPASGPILTYILNILKGYNMTDADFVKDPALIYHRYVEAFNFAYARRTELADPDIEKGIDELVKDLTSDKLGEKTRKKITDKKTHKPSYYKAKHSNKLTTGTTHMVVIAENGDAVSVMSTVNGYLGAKFRSCKLGFIYNNEMDDFSTPGLSNEFGLPPSEVNFIKPSKRPLSSSVPTLILDKDLNVKLAIGGSGGSIITTAVAEVIMNHLWLGMNIRDAVQLPRVHSQLIPNNVFVETRMSKKIIKALEKKGHNVTVTDDSHAVVQGIARVDHQWHKICKKWKVENANYNKYCVNMKKTQVGYFAESDYRKGGQPAGF